MSVESDIRNSTDKRLWHHKGYFSIFVTEVTERGGVEWVHYFVEQNCDNTYAGYEGSFLRQATEVVTGEELVRERHFEENMVRVMSMERAAKKFRLKKPAKPTPFKVTQL